MKPNLLRIVLFILFIATVILFALSNSTRDLLFKFHAKQQIPILFIPGLGLHATDYHTLLINLQKDGYKVIVYTPKDSNAADYQKLVKDWTNGIGKQIGNQKVIVIGHSVGGSTAAYFCSFDPRCVAGINLDGGAVFNNKISVPFLYIQAELGNYCDQQCIQGRKLMESITKQSGTQFIYISGIKHYNFTDIRTQAIKDKDYLGTIDGRNIIYANIHSFLNNIHPSY